MRGVRRAPRIHDSAMAHRPASTCEAEPNHFSDGGRRALTPAGQSITKGSDTRFAAGGMPAMPARSCGARPHPRRGWRQAMASWPSRNPARPGPPGCGGESTHPWREPPGLPRCDSSLRKAPPHHSRGTGTQCRANQPFNANPPSRSPNTNRSWEETSTGPPAILAYELKLSFNSKPPQYEQVDQEWLRDAELAFLERVPAGYFRTQLDVSDFRLSENPFGQSGISPGSTE